MNNIAFGAGKTGGGFDPITFALKPQVILRAACWLCCVVVWACISMNAWHKKGRKEICLFNADGTACRLGSGLAFVGFLAAMGFLALEAVFSSISSIKVRRRLVAADIGFSALWAGLFFIEFWYLAIAWNKSDYPPMGKGINNCRSAIVFSLFNIGTWAGCAYFAYQRWLQGADMTQFTSGFDPADFGPPVGMAPIQTDMSGAGVVVGAGGGGYDQAAAGYTQYSTGIEQDPGYSANPFMTQDVSAQQQFTAPSY